MEKDQFGYSRKAARYNQDILRDNKYCVQSVIPFAFNLFAYNLKNA